MRRPPVTVIAALLAAIFIAVPASASAPARADVSAAPQTYRQVLAANTHHHRGGTMITLRKGDTLSGVTRRLWGSAAAWPALWWVNRHHVRNPDRVHAGERLHLPYVHRLTAWKIRRGKAAEGLGGPGHGTISGPNPTGSLQSYAAKLFGSQYGCDAAIVMRESGWQVRATNPRSGAYGIPQALPGSKMASAGADWATDGYTQLRWMKGYVDSSYGGACAAWAFWQAHGWY